MNRPKIIKRIWMGCAGLLLLGAMEWGILSHQMDARANTPTRPGRMNGSSVERLLALQRRILVVAAHPDDSEFFCGATLTQLAKRGDEITLLVITTGGKEKYGIGIWSRWLRKTRRQEQQAAGRIVGYKRIIFWHYPDGKLSSYRDQLVPRIREIIQEVRPQIVLAYDTSHPWGMPHPDHAVGGEAAVTALDGYIPHPSVFLYGSNRPNTWVDASSTIGQKWQELGAHRSQFGPIRMHFAKDLLLQRLARREGDKIGVNCAETFRRML